MIKEIFSRAAQDSGFQISGIVDLDLAEDFKTHSEKYKKWIDLGYQGSMEYLIRGLERRLNPKLLLPTAQSVFCVGLRYSAKPLIGKKGSPRYARYLRNSDYHDRMKTQLEVALRKFLSLLPEEQAKNFEYKICVDTSAVLERSWAFLAGLGWLGKNTLLIHPEIGSYFFIGTVLTNLKTNIAPTPLKNYCGNCRKCLDHCPTQALLEPGTLDARQCISYLTLEKRGAWEISDEKKAKMKDWVAGCDLCQEICPFNSKAAAVAQTEITDDSIALGLQEALSESPSDYKLRVKDTALSRIKPEDWRRNLENAYKNLTP